MTLIFWIVILYIAYFFIDSNTGKSRSRQNGYTVTFSPVDNPAASISTLAFDKLATSNNNPYLLEPGTYKIYTPPTWAIVGSTNVLTKEKDKEVSLSFTNGSTYIYVTLL